MGPRASGLVVLCQPAKASTRGQPGLSAGLIRLHASASSKSVAAAKCYWRVTRCSSLLHSNSHAFVCYAFAAKKLVAFLTLAPETKHCTARSICAAPTQRQSYREPRGHQPYWARFMFILLLFVATGNVYVANFA